MIRIPGPLMITLTVVAVACGPDALTRTDGASDAGSGGASDDACVCPGTQEDDQPEGPLCSESESRCVDVQTDGGADEEDPGSGEDVEDDSTGGGKKDDPSAQPLKLEIDFDSGSLNLAKTRISGNTVTLQGRTNGNSGKWKWIYFRASNVRGRKLAFKIGSNFASGSSRLTRHQMVYSYDQKKWSFFDNNLLDVKASEYRFSNKSAFTGDQVYVAYGLPYPLLDALALVKKAKSSRYARGTRSGDANWSVGRSAGGKDDLGRKIPSHELHGFELSDFSVTGRKKKVVLTGGMHANETTGSHALHGLVEFLLSDRKEAAALRKKAIFYVYPMMNPDGRFAGYNRHTVEQVGEDPNRQWTRSGKENWLNNKEVRELADAMVKDTGGDVDFLIDFHSTVGTEKHFAYLDTDKAPTGRDMSQSRFWKALQAREPLVAKDGTYAANTVMRYGWSALKAEFSSTFEMYFRPGENVSRYRTMGLNIGLAFGEGI